MAAGRGLAFASAATLAGCITTADLPDAALAADETATANRFDRDVVALATYASVANTYFAVLATQDRIRITINNIGSAQRVYDAIRQRVNVGTATDLELAQQESTLANL